MKTTNVVLVHGGFVDGSGWEGVYKILRKDGYTVSVVQEPLGVRSRTSRGQVYNVYIPLRRRFTYFHAKPRSPASNSLTASVSKFRRNAGSDSARFKFVVRNLGVRGMSALLLFASGGQPWIMLKKRGSSGFSVGHF